jgi:hypothetical protein
MSIRDGWWPGWVLARTIPLSTKKFRFSGQYSADMFHAALKNGVDIYIEDASDQQIQDDLPDWYKGICNAASFITSFSIDDY